MKPEFSLPSFISVSENTGFYATGMKVAKPTLGESLHKGSE